MLINEFKIINYKSYRETTPIQLSTGFNVFIGKNNGGKTALLEALSLSTLVNKPHRHSGIPREQLVQPISSVELTVTLAPADLRRAFLSEDSFFFPVPAECDEVHAMALLHEFLQEARSFCFRVRADQSFVPLSYPSHGMFAGPGTGYTAFFHPNAEKSGFQLGAFNRNDNDTGYLAVGKFVAHRSIRSAQNASHSQRTHMAIIQFWRPMRKISPWS
jgi:AAA ATPase domain